MSAISRGQTSLWGQHNFAQLFTYRKLKSNQRSPVSAQILFQAAHCTEGITANELNVYCGSNKRGDGDLLYVSNIFVHPMYNSDNMDNDFCLLKIFGKIFYDDTKRAIALPEENEEPNVNDYVRALGWGRTMNNGESMDYLRSVVLMVIS